MQKSHYRSHGRTREHHTTGNRSEMTYSSGLKLVKEGDLLEARGLIVHGCNACGVMGAGVAKAIKERWPDVYQVYHQQHALQGLRLGEVVYVPVRGLHDVIVANAITQASTGPGLQVDYGAIRQAFKTIAQTARQLGMVVHYPKIGAGLGGGDWELISRIIDKELHGLVHVNWVLPGELAGAPEPS